VQSQQLQGQLQTQHSVDENNYITDKHNIKSKTNYRQALEEDYETEEEARGRQRAVELLMNE
jgi:hypothetical protein